MVLMNLFAGKEWRHRRREVTCKCSGGGEGRVGADGEKALTYTHPHVSDRQLAGSPAQHMELSLVLCDEPEGRGAGGTGYLYTHSRFTSSYSRS